MAQFAIRSSMTFASRIASLVMGVITSVVIARVLGPQGKGVYTLCALFPLFIVTLFNLGIVPGTAYHLAVGRYRPREAFANNLLFSAVVGTICVLIGSIILGWFREQLFPGIAPRLIFLSLSIIIPNLSFLYLQAVFLGLQNFKEYNLADVLRSILYMIFVGIALCFLGTGISGVLLASALAWLSVDCLLIQQARKITGPFSFKLNFSYLRAVVKYGFQAHLGNVFSFLNYRVDMFIVNWFLGAAAVGFYSIGVLLVEQLWLVSGAASLVLFPKIAAEKDRQKRKEFTPMVARSVLLVTLLGSSVFFFLGPPIIVFLFSSRFLPAVIPFKILLVGIVALSVSRIMANDMAGRGLPLVNSILSLGTLGVNLSLNFFLIPRYGLAGAAWSSTISYSLMFFVCLAVYSRISGNSWIEILVPRRGDWTLYKKTLTDFSPTRLLNRL